MQEFTGVAHFVLNEAEITLPLFLEDLRRGTPQALYTTSAAWADLSTTPLPMWELIDQRKYATMNVQYSRGCPYDCEFCDITVLYGRRPRTKSADAGDRGTGCTAMRPAGGDMSSSWMTTSSATRRN